MAKIAVTGAGGFIGSNVVQELIKRGHTVRGIDAKFPEDRKPLLAGAELISADLRNSGVAEHVFEDMEMVIHLASNMGGVGYFTYNDYYPFIDNMQMDMNVLLGAEKRGVQRLFYASSACIYPTHIQMEEGNAPKLNERMVYPANSDLSYGWEKLMMLRLCERSPLDARVGILHTVYGVHQESHGQRMKAPTALATKAIKSKETGTFEIWGNGKQIRSFCYITDAVEKILRVLFADHYMGAVNIGSDVAVTVQEVAEMCCDIVGSKPTFTYTTDKPSGVLARNCDNTKFERVYGYQNQVSPREGFTKLINWLQEGK